MREIDIPIPPGSKLTAIEAAVDKTCRSLGLHIVLRTNLRKYPGCIHWHVRKKWEKGTLELTAWPNRRPLWLKIHPGRSATWIESVLSTLVADLPSNLEMEDGRMKDSRNGGNSCI